MESIESILDSLIPIIAILSAVALPIVLGVYLCIKVLAARHKERMELIKQGIMPAEQSKPTPNKYRSLRNGILCIGIALGLIISLIICQAMELSEDAGFLVVASGILLFLGIAYVVFYMLVNKDKEIDDSIE